MPGTNLTREEARRRASILTVDSYEVELDLTVSDKFFTSRTVIRFGCREPGASSFADLIGATLTEVSLNDEPLDQLDAYRDGRVRLDGLAEHNELVVTAELPYSHNGEGLHRFVDPVDDRVYLYSQFEVPDARRVYATFEQPDLKAVFTFTVTAPDSWTVVSNASAPEPEPLAGRAGAAVWRFPTTLPMSTYVTAVVAGEYDAVLDVYEGKHGDIPLGFYCRRSMRPYLDVEELLEVTRQGFAFFEDTFDYPYPFGKYDQVFAPEYNMGAMENVGCVTLRDELLPRSRQTRAFYEQRANTILHEMAHMWFGDLVTMRWWDDLWLNESFAEWAAYHAASRATRYTDAWTSFTNSRKNWAYRQDQLPSTHPIAADNHDLEAVEVNFDGITYAKGASTLKQLVAWVGEEEFLAALHAYFRRHEFGNSEFADLLAVLEEASGRELQEWAEEWLQTSGVNTLEAELDVARDESDGDGETVSSFVVRQSAPPGFPTLRRHRIAIGLYDDRDGRLVRRTLVETDVRGERTSVEALAGERRPDLVLLNDGDLTYAKIRLDQRSLATLVTSIDRLDDSLARALCWGAAWDMTRDAELRPTDFVRLVLRGIATETDLTAVGALLRYARTAVETYSAPRRRAELAATWEAGLRRLLEEADPGTDHQLAFVRAFAGAAHSDQALDLVRAVYDGSRPVPGLAVDADLRWTLLAALARGGRAGEAEIDAEVDRDNTISGRERAAGARALMPTVAAKHRAWQQAVERDDVANETQRHIAASFAAFGQEALLEPYVERYLAAAETIWDDKGVQRATVVLTNLFPRQLATRRTLDRVTAWLATTQANPAAQRYVREGVADLERALAAQARDAEPG